MSASVLRVAGFLVRLEAAATGLNKPEARANVARKAGVAPGALDRLFRGTLKNLDRVGAKLDELLISTGERQIAAIQHEMDLARARGAARPEVDVDALESALEAARAALGKSPRQNHSVDVIGNG